MMMIMMIEAVSTRKTHNKTRRRKIRGDKREMCNYCNDRIGGVIRRVKIVE